MKKVNERGKNATKPKKKLTETKKEVTKKKKEDTKTGVFSNTNIIIIVFSLAILGLVLGYYLSNNFLGNGESNKNVQIIKTSKGNLKIVKSEASKVQYEKFDNGLVSLDIPKGWKVDVAALDYIHYSFKVYNPSDPLYMFLFCMKLEGFNKSEAARNWQKKYYPDVVFAKIPAIDPQNTQGFYKVWNETASYVNTNDVKREYMPKLNDFNVIEKIGTNEINGDVLRATFKDEKGSLAQGLFTASVMSAGTYYVNSNAFDLTSAKIDVFPLNVYNIILMTTPDEEFNNWQGILDKCVGSISFSQTFVDGFNKEESNILSTIQANQKIYNETSDMIMDSWEKRNNSYDITSQKQSDATLGYERVYDTETGDIYKAYNGFTDDYSGNRYKAITDDMYTKAVTGYIEK